MFPETLPPAPPINPPRFWHEAIRKTYPGYEINPNKFESVPLKIAEKFSGIILSLTAPDERTGLPEGVYVATDIPVLPPNQMGDLIVPLVKSLKDLFTKENPNKTRGLDNIDPRLSELGVTADFSTSIGVVFIPTNGVEILRLVPVTTQTIAETHQLNSGFDQLKNGLVQQYFEKLTTVERMKLLFDKEFPILLKKEILRREIMDMNRVIQKLLADEIVKPDDLEFVWTNENIQEEYKALLEKMGNFKSKEEAEQLTLDFFAMDQKKFAGWANFLQRYWEEKLGPLT